MQIFTRFFLMLEHAVQELLRHKLRSFLTMFGIGWGICSLALIMAVTEGFRRGHHESWKQFGDRVVMIFDGRTEMQAGGERAGRRIWLHWQDVDAIREQCPAVEAVTADVKSYDVSVESDFNSGRFLIIGANPDYQGLRNLRAGKGRDIKWIDVNQRNRVCVLGNLVRKQLFEDRQAIGEFIRINGQPYEVVGLMQQKNETQGNMDGWDNEKIVVPVSSLLNDFPPSPEAVSQGRVSMIIYRPRSADQWKETQQKVRAVIARRQGFDARDEAATPIRDTIEESGLFEDMHKALQRFLASVALITLSLGGLGVMNTMMTSIAERTAEIGLKKALGATSRRILVEFTLEGLLLAVISGMAGMVLVSILAIFINQLPLPPLFAGLAVDARLVLELAFVLGAVAVVSALPPAWRAAKLTPVQALHFDK
ncbi:MAG: ABC transporter permease [Acidobacteria bacterium]|nr:MAG: ABC transporter permease [Acidobacteriota bacterium]